jgi:hypothetical protein
MPALSRSAYIPVPDVVAANLRPARWHNRLGSSADRLLSGEPGMSFQGENTWKTSTDRDREVKKDRVLELYAVAADAPLSPGDPPPGRTGGSSDGRLRLDARELQAHVTTRKSRTQFLAFCRYLRSQHWVEVRIVIVLDE